MATLNKTQSANARPTDGVRKPFVMKNPVDLTGVATGDVAQVLSIPAGVKVLDVIVKVITPTGLVSTATVGDTGGAASWDASTNFNAAAGTITNATGGVDAYATAGGKIYTADSTIDLTCTITGGPCTTGKLEVSAICVDLR